MHASDAWLLFSLHRLLCLEQMSQQETPKRKGKNKKSVYSTSELEGLELTQCAVLAITLLFVWIRPFDTASQKTAYCDLTNISKTLVYTKQISQYKNISLSVCVKGLTQYTKTQTLFDQV